MATVPSNQPDSQRGATAPSNDLTVEVVNDTQDGGFAGEDFAGSVAAGVAQPTEQR